MAKRILSIVAALLVAFIIITGFEELGPILFKTPVIDSRDPKTISDMMQHMPLAAFLWLLLGYALAAFLGGLVATYISGRDNILPAIMIGVFLIVGSIMNFIQIPGHPIWFIVVNILLYLPCAWLGYLLAKKKEVKAA